MKEMVKLENEKVGARCIEQCFTPILFTKKYTKNY